MTTTGTGGPLTRIAAAEQAQQEAITEVANEAADALISKRGGKTVDVGQFTLAMHGFKLEFGEGYTVSQYEPVKLSGANLEGRDETAARYLDLKKRFESGRFVDMPVARVVNTPELFLGDEVDASQISEIAVTRGHIWGGHAVRPSSLEYRLKAKPETARSRPAYEGTVELPVHGLQVFGEGLDMSRPDVIDERIVLARLVRPTDSLVLRNPGQFFDDEYFIGMDEIVAQRQFDRFEGNAGAEHDELFLKRALMAKEASTQFAIEQRQASSETAPVPDIIGAVPSQDY